MEDVYLQHGDNNQMSVKNEKPGGGHWFLVAVVTAVLAIGGFLSQEWLRRIIWPGS